MLFFAAIDLLGGKAVRLAQGDRARATVYHEDPPQLVRELGESGADRVHVVDLDGAFTGNAAHRPVLERIIAAASAANVPVQVGGGLRDERACEEALAVGASYLVLGTIAVRDPAATERICRRYPGQIVVAVDARDGVVAIEGWTEASTLTAAELGRRAAGWGASALLYTDVSRDGMRGGANIEATVALERAVGCPVIASGGVGDLGDIVALRDAGAWAVVVGRALYERKMTPAEAARAAHAPRGTPC